MRSMGVVSNRRQGRMPVHLSVSITKKVDGAYLANEWHERLNYLTNGSSHVYAASPKKLIVQTADATAGIVLPWLAQQPETSWVEAREVMTTRNKWAKGIIQSGNSSFTPLHDRGILGRGVVVGIADTGLDHKLCYFHDPHRAVPFNRVDQSHRKIIAYKYRAGLGNAKDEEGHGTHTSGSIAGNALAGGEQGRFDGTAPAAK
jgi:subtilisin family serine protease